jgi:hypothetical protein
MRKKHEQSPKTVSPPTPETLRLSIAVHTQRCPRLPSPRVKRPQNGCINFEAMRALEALCWTRRYAFGRTH